MLQIFIDAKIKSPIFFFSIVLILGGNALQDHRSKSMYFRSKETPRDGAASLSEVADSLAKVCEKCFVFGVLPRGDESLQTLSKEVNSKLNEIESESTWSFVGISRVLYNLKHIADDQVLLKPTAFGKMDSLLLKRVSFSARF